MKIEQLRRELSYKQRSIADVVRFIKTRSDGDNPNHSLFLGAGCSVTSGVKSAGELIKQWRKEVFLSCKPDCTEADYTEEKSIAYLSEQHSAWYDKRNEYASLFEKRYDLPRQRRMFIEQEVANKVPSLGYAYLVRLVKKSYFRAIFTTNFDDLINEAFYLYSDERPIVCAHDSAIGSITVTSKRPKIIKLHGDYLFDDIKSTLRETESLEENIKNKFVEFAKDYGLIVVGYGGNDRSILDVLFYLLKQDEYLKNGIYYCFRQDEDINEEVRKLLWKDRVYYVIIDGFDELMAELNKRLNKDELPVETSIISGKTNKVIEHLLNNERLRASSSTIIREDLQTLKQQREETFTQELLRSLQSSNERPIDGPNHPKSGPRKKGEMSLQENILILRLYEKMRKNRQEDVIEEAKNILKEGQLSQAFHKDLMNVLARAQLKGGYREEAKKTYEDLAEMDDDDTGRVLAAQLSPNPENQVLMFNKILEKTPYDHILYYHKGKALIRLYRNQPRPKSMEQFETVMSTLQHGVKVNPSLDNPCWWLIFNFSLNDTPNKEIGLQTARQTLETIRPQNPFDLRVVDMQVELLLKEKADETQILDVIKTARDNNSRDDALDFEILFLRTCEKLNATDKIKTQLWNIEQDHEPTQEYLALKADILLDKFDDLQGAIKTAKQALELGFSLPVLRQLVKYYLYAGSFKEAEAIVFSQLGSDNEEERIEYFQAKRDYEKALDILRSASHNTGFLSTTGIVQETFFLLKLKRYDQAEKLAREYLEKCNFDEGALVINYELARKLLGKKVNKDRLSKLSTLDDSDIVRAAAYTLNDDKDKALALLSEIVKKDNSKKYYFRDWAVFDSLRNDPSFEAIFHIDNADTSDSTTDA